MYRFRIPKINPYNLLYDFRDFLRGNIRKLIVMTIVHLIAIILGIRAGLSVYNVDNYLLSHAPNAFLFLIGKRNIFAYFVIGLLIDLAILALLTLASANFLLAFTCYILLFLRTYLFCLYLCLYIILFKLSVFPFILFCLIPLYIVRSFLFIAVAICAMNCARDRRLYGSNCGNSMMQFARKMLIPCIMLVILSLIGALLSYFLTLGIIF